MAGTLLLSFTSGPDPFPNVRVHRVELIDALNEPFSLTVEVTSTDPAVDPRAVVGREARLALEGEPFLPEVSIVLLDVPELHLHGADHEAFIPRLLRLGGDNQLIVATGSSAMITAASREQTIVLRRDGNR